MKYVIRWLIRRLFNLIAHVDVSGYEHLPKEGSFVIATNHLGIVDVPLAFYALDRWDMFVMIGEKINPTGLNCAYNACRSHTGGFRRAPNL